MACPFCSGTFVVDAPPAAKSINIQVKHWIVEARILLLRAPPTYVKMLIELPQSWAAPPDGMLPGPAFEAVTKAIRSKFPQCPVTPVKVHAADPQALRRISDQTDYCGEFCKAWFLGRATSCP